MYACKLVYTVVHVPSLCLHLHPACPQTGEPEIYMGKFKLSNQKIDKIQTGQSARIKFKLSYPQTNSNSNCTEITVTVHFVFSTQREERILQDTTAIIYYSYIQFDSKNKLFLQDFFKNANSFEGEFATRVFFFHCSSTSLWRTQMNYIISVYFLGKFGEYSRAFL